jgi:hypothetical protein
MENEINTNEISRKLGSLRYELSFITTSSFILALVGIRSCQHVGRIADSLELATQNKQNIQTRDVVGNEQPERFYEFNGQRVYLEIDCKPVESYFLQKPIPGGIR